MKCIHCESEWNVNPGLSKSITNCPFCGKPLLPEKKKFDTVEDVLVEINRRFGVNILTDETKLVAYFSDLAPQLSKQRRILGYFVECGGPKKLVAVMSSSQNEQTICIKQIVKEMKEEMFIEESASQMICDSFLFAVSGHRIMEVATPIEPKSDAPSSTPAIVKKVIVSAPSADELFQKAEDYYHGTPTVFRDYQRAIDCYQKAAVQGHAMAQCQLGLMYREGQGTAKDEKKAFDWFMKAANAAQNCPRGKFYVGRCYHYGHGVQKDYKEAVRWYTIGAKEGDSFSQVNLGNCYEWGDGVEINYETAVYWYELSAKQGEPLAQCNLGLMYKRGRGVTQDKAKAFALFKQSADQGEPYGILQMGLCYMDGDGVKKDKDQAFTLVKRAAELGESFAQYKLAYGYEKGIWCIENPQEAFAWYKKAAQNGSALAQASLGRCYAQGYGVKKDLSEAVAWYQKAANNGNGNAMAFLGECYEKGTGIAKNEAQALIWYEKSVQKGSPFGMIAMLLLFTQKESMTEAECKTFMHAVGDIEKALEPVLAKSGYFVALEMVRYASTRATGAKIMNLCANSGNADAQLWLGQSYDVGSPLRKDKNLAIHWYKKAADQGNETAAALLRKLIGINLSEERVRSLVNKYQLEYKYLTSSSLGFTKKLAKAANAYATNALREQPVLMEDNTIFGSAKEGFVLTSKNLYYKLMAGQGQIAIDKIESVSYGQDKLSHVDLIVAPTSSKDRGKKVTIAYVIGEENGVKICAFWRELLNLPEN